MDRANNDRERIGGLIRAMRQERGMTQEQLAELAGMSRTTICKIESGKFNASIDLLAKVIAPLGAEITIMETVIKQEKQNMKGKLYDILVAISWADLSRKYFGRSSSWLYHKMDGRDVNGKKVEFTPEEASQLKGALYDLSERIRRAAETI